MESLPLLRCPINSETDVVDVRSRSRELAAHLQFEPVDQTRFATAVSELVRNAYRYAGGGTAAFFVEGPPGHRELRTAVSDSGPGIDNLDVILAGNYKSRTGLGKGLAGVRRIASYFAIESDAGKGTRVVIGHKLPAAAQNLPPSRIVEMAAISTKQAVEDPRQALLRQNRELMEVLLMLQEQNQRLQDANQELEVTNQGVVALNLELTNTADQLAAAARLKSEFLSNMSHEIRTPMNGVIGMTTLLESTEMSGEQKEFVSIIRTCGENLLTIINDILDYSKIDSGKLELESRAFCLESVAEQALELVTPAAASQGIHLGLRIGDGVPRWITGDQVRLSQILLNLISNAVKFTRRGSVTLALEREDPISGAPQLRADIIDTGVGISSSKLERLFQPFSQVDSSTTRVFGGTGLGLAIVKRLAELMGGNVAVRSTEGAGSVFTVCIPLRSSSCPDLYSEPDLPAHSRLLLAANAKDAPVLMSVLHRSGIAPAAICLPASTREFLDRAGPFDALATTELLANFPSTPTLVLLPDFRQNCPQHPLHTVFLPHGPRKIAAALRSLLAPAAISASRPSAVSLTRRSQPRPMHVLVADDSRINQRVASHLLKALGHTFELALNGRIALDMTVSGAFDAVLLDMHMPEMDGYQVSAELKRRANSGTQVPFVIAFTAAAMEEDRQRCLNAGASAYLTKPVNLEKLAAALALAGQQPTPV